MPQDFPLGTVLSITNGRLLAPNHIGGVYEILNYMTRDNLYTHQLPRASRECRPHLLRQFPQLADEGLNSRINDFCDGLESVSNDERARRLELFMAGLAEEYGECLSVERIPADDHERRDPVNELEQMVGRDKVIVI